MGLELTMRRFFRRALLIIREAVCGHLLNPVWHSRMERRHTRGEAGRRAIMWYLGDYLPFVSSLVPDVQTGRRDSRRIFSLWLQGEASAPEIVKACWRSVRANCTEELVILDERSLGNWITLPEHIMRKWSEGKIKPAHFADICRVELLYRYGGIWLDATDFVPAAFPEWLWDADFFVYMSGNRQKGYYSFIQNCFIRSCSSSFLIRAWRDLIFEYWSREDSAADYFVHQLLFRLLVENNAAAGREFARMPRKDQDATHLLWFDGNAGMPFDDARYREICSGALFQKTEYKSVTAKCPPAGSVARALIEMYR